MPSRMRLWGLRVLNEQPVAGYPIMLRPGLQLIQFGPMELEEPEATCMVVTRERLRPSQARVPLEVVRSYKVLDGLL